MPKLRPHARSFSSLLCLLCPMLALPFLFVAAAAQTPPATCPAPTFNQMRSYYIDYVTFPGRTAVGDLNGDGRPDLITGELVYGGATTMTIMLGVGSHGGFAEETNYTVAGDPRDFTTADVNNDGFLDVINTQFGSVDIYLGRGDGTVQTPAIVYRPLDGTRPSTTIARDFNNDGNVDLAVSTTDLYPSYLLLRFGNGNGTFNDTQTIAVNNTELPKIFAADLNNDGRLDLVAPGDQISRIFFGTADGRFAPPVNAPGIPSRDVQFFDLNGDGALDIYAVSNTVRLYYNNGAGAFSAPATAELALPPGSNVTSGKAADFNGDGLLDIAAATNFPDFRIYRGTSPTSFELTSITNLNYTAYGLQLADFNNDGRTDFAASGYDSSSMYVFTNKCGVNAPTYSISGALFNNEGFFINGARVRLNSPLYGSLSTVSSFGSYTFEDLPAGLDYTVTPTHPLFNFSPASFVVRNLGANQPLSFEGTIRRFSIYGTVTESGTNGTPTANVPMRLVGPYDTDQSVTTGAGGEYNFRDLLPINADVFYQVQFPANPIFQATTPAYAIRGLTADRLAYFTVSRRRYGATLSVKMPNEQPRPGIVMLHGQSGSFGITDAAGRTTIANLKAGLEHTFIPAIPSLRFTPEPGRIAFLEGDANVDFKVALRNRSDFDRDGKTDLAVWRPSNGVWYGRSTTDGQFWAHAFGTSGDVPVPADYDGDQKTDLAVFRPADGTWHLLLSANQSYAVSSFGTNGDEPVAADFDRDGKTDFTVFRPATGVWYTYQSYWRSVSIVQWGLTGDRPLFGDFDGDSYHDRAVFRPSNGVWYILYSGNNNFRAVQFGLAGDRTMAADFDGDTRSDLVVFRPSTGIWYVLASADDSYRINHFGLAGDEPLSGDFDGDGRADTAVFRPSNGTWYVWKSSDGGYLIEQFGLAEDRPVPATGVR